MSKEAYVSFGCAKLLKEKGFAWRVFNFYDEHGIFSEHIGSVYSLYNWNYPTKDEYGSQYCSAPTQQMACRWLREEKGIHPELELCIDNEFSFTIYKLNGKRTVLYEEKHCWTKPEDAIEAALKYVLTNMI